MTIPDLVSLPGSRYSSQERVAHCVPRGGGPFFTFRPRIWGKSSGRPASSEAGGSEVNGVLHMHNISQQDYAAPERESEINRDVRI